MVSLNPYFIGLPILIYRVSFVANRLTGLNPYFIGLPILIMTNYMLKSSVRKSQSLFYWITYSYNYENEV